MRLPAIFQLRELICSVLALSLGYANGQNLVRNPGFEEYVDCDLPIVIDINRLNPPSCPYWWTATDTRTTHQLGCHEYIANAWWFAPHSGQAYTSIGAVLHSPPVFEREDERVFLQTKLLEPLIAGCTYEVAFFVRPFATVRPGGSYFTGPVFPLGLGALLTKDAIKDHIGYSNLIKESPQIQSLSYLEDTTQFHLISGQFVASGGEEYLTIGIFAPSYLLQCKTINDSIVPGKCNALFDVDDVSVIKIPTGSTFEDLLPNDTLINPNDTVNLFTGVPNTVWNTSETGESITVSTPGKYWYTIEEPCFTYSDTINIASEELILHIPNAFTPNNDGLNDNLEFRIYGVENYKVRIYDRWGKMLYQQEGVTGGMFSWDGKVQGKNALMGIYILQISSAGKHGQQQITEKIHLIR